MPLFKCSRCGAVENTACGHFWLPNARDEPVLCSECYTGTWHHRFPKTDADAAGYVPSRDGFIEKKKP